tara:strand:+ start:2313 stop:2915 length:603 start_codon:yes stop_codon:yes gene_type:complete
MIIFKNLLEDHPFIKLKKKYDKALNYDQQSIEAMAVSTIDQNKNKVNSRFVNAKFIIKDEIIFFSNYESVKAKDIESNNSVSCLFYWNSIKTQIRIKGFINKSDPLFCDNYFKTRDHKKNSIAISSEQSKKILSYDDVLKKYESTLSKDKEYLSSRPSYWGGYSIKPQYIEFWEGNDSRINKRKIYEINNGRWDKYFLQP